MSPNCAPDAHKTVLEHKENTEERASAQAGQAGSHPDDLFSGTESESEKPPGAAPPPFHKNGESAANLNRPKKATEKNGSTPQSKIPDIEEFVAHGKTRGATDQDCRDLYQIWIDSDGRDGNGKKIINWKGALTNFIKIGNMPSDKKRKNSTGTFTPKPKTVCNI